MQKVGEKEGQSEDVQQDLGRIGSADLVLGIPTYNNRDTIARTAEAGLAALDGGFSGQRGVIINADGSSRDGTTEHLREIVGDRIPLLQVRYPVYPVNRFSAPLAGVPGRNEAALNIFRLARQLGAKACALLDAEVESITPEWIERLTRPILDGSVDLVVPSYRRQQVRRLDQQRHPLPVRARPVRQAPAAAGRRGPRIFRAASWICTSSRPFPMRRRRRSLDPWSAVPAVIHGFRVGQSFLGTTRRSARARSRRT